MIDSQKAWYVKLGDWINANKSNLGRVSEIPAQTINHWLRGNVRLENIDYGTRAVLYKETDIEDFKFEGYVDPEKIDVDEILSGEQPRSYLRIWLDTHNSSFSKLAEDCGVSRQTVRRFVTNESITEGAEEKIRSALRKYSKGSLEIQSEGADKLETARIEDHSESYDLGKIVQMIESANGLIKDVKGELALHVGSVEAARMLATDYEPSREQRLRTVETAIDILVDQASYFAQATPQERKALVERLEETGEVHRWGYLVNVLGGINKPDNSPDTFVRSLQPPTKKPRRKNA